MKLLGIEDGACIVKLARRSIEFFMHAGRLLPDASPKAEYLEKRGVFVSLHTYPGHELRGCIGYPEPIAMLWEAVKECAVSAAFRDPRFSAVGAEELGRLVVEVSVLTKPEEVKAKHEEWPGIVECGRHGLIIEKGARKGLLLPQVAMEYRWPPEEFLQHTCLKAGLGADEWVKPGCRLHTFEAQVFREEKPKGKVVEGEEGTGCG